MIDPSILTKKEYTTEYLAILEIKYAYAMTVIDEQMKLINRLMGENIQIADELFKNTEAILKSPYLISLKEKQV